MITITITTNITIIIAITITTNITIIIAITIITIVITIIIVITGRQHDHHRDRDCDGYIEWTPLRPDLTDEETDALARLRGIFKPRQMEHLLSIKTVFPRRGSRVWYDDQREAHRQ